jgi:uncharacterized membrane protein
MSAPFQPKVSQVVKRLPSTTRFVSLLGSAVLVPAGIALRTLPAQGQDINLVDPFPVTSFNFTQIQGTPTGPFNRPYIDTCDQFDFPGCDISSLNVSFGQGNDILLQSVVGTTATGLDVTFIQGALFNERTEFRRSNNPLSRDNLFYQEFSRTPAQPRGGVLLTDIEIAPDETFSLGGSLLLALLNRGVDNVFDNVGGGANDTDDTRNNIERIDYIVDSGLSDPIDDGQTLGFLVLDRGGNDNFRIAAITALDAAGNPAAWGAIVAVDAADWGNSDDVPIDTVVFRREAGTGDFLLSHYAPAGQSVEGVIFPVNALAPNPGDQIFGYSLFAADTPTSNAIGNTQYTNINDTSLYPQTTNDTTEGGLDLIAAGFGVLTTQQTGFTITPDTDLTTTVGVPVDHPFTVTNTGSIPQTIPLTTSGTDTNNFTVEIIDENGNVVTDTGILQPNQTGNFILRVTPLNLTSTPDQTVVTAGSPTIGTQTVTKTTRLANFTLTSPGELPGTPGQPTNHPFTITNNGTVPEEITLTTEGTDTNNFTTRIIDPATGNEVTGPVPLGPGQSRDLILEVIPGPNATTPDATIIRATSNINQATQTITKITNLQQAAIRITPDGDLVTPVGVPVDHPFTVTNLTGAPANIPLTTSNTQPGYTAQIIDPATGNPVTETGILQPDQTVSYVLRVTPPNTFTNVIDQTIITGTDPNNRTQSITKITRLENFTLTSSGELPGTPEEPVDHPFTVTNVGPVPDEITLTLEGTTPGYNVVIIDPATNQPVTGPVPLGPGETANLILRVTPGANVTGPDNTVIRGVSRNNGGVQTIVRTTTLADDGTGNISLTKRITRVFRNDTGLVEVYNAEVPATLPAGFVGVTSPTPVEMQSGDLVEYTIYFNNETTGRVTNLEICDPIPTESEFVGDPTFVPDFQATYSSGRSILYDGPAALPLGLGGTLSNVFDNDQGEYVNPLTPRASCPGQTSGNQGAVVVRVGPVDPGEAGFIKFVTRLQ